MQSSNESPARGASAIAGMIVPIVGRGIGRLGEPTDQPLGGAETGSGRVA